MRVLAIACLLLLAPALRAAGEFDEALDADDRVFIAPELSFSGRDGDPGRLFGGRGAGARFVLVLTGDRSPGDADIVLDLALSGGSGDRLQSLALGARWIPRVRPRHTPFLGGGISLDWAQLAEARRGGCCGHRHDTAWGVYLAGGLEFDTLFVEVRARRLSALAGRNEVLWSAGVGWAF